MTKPTPTEEHRRAATTIAVFCLTRSAVGDCVEHLAALLAEREAALREEHQRACETIAAMHAAAVGSVRGPIVGVVEDVVALRERAEKARRDAAWSRSVVDNVAESLGLRLSIDDDGVIDAVEAVVAERDHALANLATVQREHDALTRSTEAARAAIAQALGLTEWRALADLAVDVAKLRAELDEALAGAVAAGEESRIYLAQRESMRSALAEMVGVALDCQQRWSRGHPARVEHAQRVLADHDTHGQPMPLVPRARVEEAEQALAASRAEVEALLKRVSPMVRTRRHSNTDLWSAEERALGAIVDAVERLGAHPLLTEAVTNIGLAQDRLAHWHLATSTPAPASADREALREIRMSTELGRAHQAIADASAEPATPTTSPVCSTCKDTHLMEVGGSFVMCTRCPRPCQQCARGGGFGPYCAKTPCACACHATPTTEGGAK